MNSDVSFRVAELRDLTAIVGLLADDDLGKTRETFSGEVASEYTKAFGEIEKDAGNELIVGVHDGNVVAVLQMTYIPNLTLKGTKRAQVEGVRVASSMRGHGVGEKLFDFAMKRAREKGCGLAQLTTNKSRLDAIRFYEKLGFKVTHEGMKLEL